MNFVFRLVFHPLDIMCVQIFQNLEESKIWDTSDPNHLE
jgi:hypothetical protein